MRLEIDTGPGDTCFAMMNSTRKELFGRYWLCVMATVSVRCCERKRRIIKQNLIGKTISLKEKRWKLNQRMEIRKFPIIAFNCFLREYNSNKSTFINFKQIRSIECIQLSIETWNWNCLDIDTHIYGPWPANDKSWPHLKFVPLCTSIVHIRFPTPFLDILLICEIQLFNLLRTNQHDTEVIPGHRIMEICDFLT